MINIKEIRIKIELMTETGPMIEMEVMIETLRILGEGTTLEIIGIKINMI